MRLAQIAFTVQNSQDSRQVAYLVMRAALYEMVFFVDPLARIAAHECRRLPPPTPSSQALNAALHEMVFLSILSYGKVYGMAWSMAWYTAWYMATTWYERGERHILLPIFPIFWHS